MTHVFTSSSLMGAALAAALLVAPGAQAQDRGGPGVSAGMRGGAQIGSRNFSAGPRASIQQSGPRMIGGGGIQPRIRSGAINTGGGAYVSGGYGGAAPLTISRNRTYATNTGYRSSRQYYVRNGYDRRYDNRGWFPGLLAAPFVVAGGLLGGGYGYDYDYDYGYEPAYYPYGGGYYSTPVTYGGGSYGGQFGNYCATPQKTCQLYTPAEVGVGCSCRAPAGLPRFQGEVVP
jgi:hypothetical protein